MCIYVYMYECVSCVSVTATDIITESVGEREKERGRAKQRTLTSGVWRWPHFFFARATNRTVNFVGGHVTVDEGERETCSESNEHHHPSTLPVSLTMKHLTSEKFLLGCRASERKRETRKIGKASLWSRAHLHSSSLSAEFEPRSVRFLRRSSSSSTTTSATAITETLTTILILCMACVMIHIQ